MDKDILIQILKDDEACQFLKKLLLADVETAPTAQSVYVWCAECLNRNDGKTYYHPMVTATETPTLDKMMSPDYYHMLADENQFAAHQWDSYCRMASEMSGKKMMLVAVPKSVFAELQTALTGLITKILTEVQKTFVPLDNIGRYTRTDADSLKVNMLINIFNQMDTLYECFDQDMVITDGSDHDYSSDEDEYDDDDDDDCIDDCEECDHYDWCTRPNKKSF